MPSPVPINASARFCGTARRSLRPASARRRLSASGGPGAHRVDAGLLARMRRHRRDVAGGEYRCVARRAQRLVNHQKSALVERQPGIGQPWRAARLGDPQRFVESDRVAVRRDQPAGFDPPSPACRSPPGCRAVRAGARDDRARCRLCEGSRPSRVTSVTSGAVPSSPASRCCAASASSTPPAPPPTTASRKFRVVRGAREQRLPAPAEPVDRLDGDGVLGGAGHVVAARHRADIERHERRSGSAGDRGTAHGEPRGRARSPRHGSAAPRQSAPAAPDRYGIRQSCRARRYSPAACRNTAFRGRG